MKRLSLIISTIFISSLFYSVSAQKKTPETITWYSFEKAIEMNKNNKKDKKKLFIDVFTEWCGWCKKMDSETFKDSAVIAVMNKYFIAVKLDAERKDTVLFNGSTYVNPSPSTPRSTHQLAITLLQGQMAYPAFVFMGTDDKVITNVKGYRVATEFINILKYYGEDIYLTKSWTEYQNGLNTPQK
jgi:thioredoxin-related protein